MSKKKNILYVEDSPDYQIMVIESLKDEFNMTLVSDAESAIRAIQSHSFDLFLLDIHLPDASGLEICSFIKGQSFLSRAPVILLTGDDDLEDKLTGFKFGANDYLTKPIDIRELRARINAHLQGRSHLHQERHILLGYTIDVLKQQVSSPEKVPIDLTRIEFRILTFFAERIDHILSRSQILNSVWTDNLNITERTVDSHISNLRKKLGPLGQQIVAVHGLGYKLTLNLKKSKAS